MNARYGNSHVAQGNDHLPIATDAERITLDTLEIAGPYAHLGTRREAFDIVGKKPDVHIFHDEKLLETLHITIPHHSRAASTSIQVGRPQTVYRTDKLRNVAVGLYEDKIVQDGLFTLHHSVTLVFLHNPRGSEVFQSCLP